MSHADTAGPPKLTLLQWAQQQGKGVVDHYRVDLVIPEPSASSPSAK
jgi:hypothetical protein